MNKPLKRICLISVEIFAFGKHGGFGKATRTIGRELVKRGYEVFAVVPRRGNQLPEENLDGITVLSFFPGEIGKSEELYKKINADIYHSCEPSFGTYLAHKHVPQAKHVATIRDPRDAYDWVLEFIHPSKSKWQVVMNYVYETNFLVRKAVRNNHAVFSPAKFLIPKIQRIYNLRKDVTFLPTPTEIPEIIVKSREPHILMMNRLDPRKRPELYLSLAEKFPNVHFHVAGKSRVPAYEEKLKKQFSGPNITFHGFVDQFSGTLHHDLMEKAWILVNTATREGLPNSILEACGHECAILSHVNPDQIATEFGFHVTKENFEEGLRWLLEQNHWKEQGMKGYQYVKSIFALDRAMDQHERVYHDVWNNTLQRSQNKIKQVAGKDDNEVIV